jgi:hypothetical protein
VLLAIMMAVFGLAMAQDITPGTYPYEVAEKNITFNFEQSVNGNGYFVTYRYAKMGALALKDYLHGSGSIDNNLVMFAQNSIKETHPVKKDWNDETVNCLSLREDNKMVYSPMKIAIGTGYYATNPLVYDSLLKEKTWVKNYRAMTSMHHEVEYAHGLTKKLDVLAKERTNRTYDPEWLGVGVTQMKVDEHVDEGKAHFGVLQGPEDLSGVYSPVYAYPTENVFHMANAWKNPSIEIDEDYFGTYDIVKNMTLEVPYRLVQKGDDWLPCCSGGWDDMADTDKKGYGPSTKGIFDCSCYKVPTEAEFQRVYA